MTIAVTAAPLALQGLQQVVDPRGPGVHDGRWRWTVRQRLAEVRDALRDETGQLDEGWLAARADSLRRDRAALLTRLSRLSSSVLEASDVEAVRADLRRLALDIEHHLQRIRDLAYDAVELELGGSE